MKKIISACLALVIFSFAAEAQTNKPQQKKLAAKKTTKAKTVQAVKSQKVYATVLKIKPVAKKEKE